MRFFRMLAGLIYVLIPVVGIIGCGSDASYPNYDFSNPSPGDEVVWAIGYGGKTIHEITMKAELIEGEVNGAPETAMWFFQSHEVLDDAASGIQVAISPNNYLSVQDVVDFLEAHWDDYIDGVDDPGFNAAQFADYLEKHEMNHHDFITLFESHGGSFSDFMHTMNELDRLDPDEGDELADLLLFFEANEIGFEELSAALNEYGMTLAEFVDHMKVCELDFITLSNADEDSLGSNDARHYSDANGELRPADLSKFTKVLGDINKMATDWAKVGLDVSKFAWSVIKDGKPAINAGGSATAILNAKDSSPLNYQNVKSMDLPPQTITPFLIKIPFHEYACAAQWAAHIDYAAQNPKFGGYYIPNLLFDVNWVRAFWSYSVDMAAVLGKPVNMGTVDNPDPKFMVNNHFRAGNFFYIRLMNIKWEALGSKGLTFKGVTG